MIKESDMLNMEDICNNCGCTYGSHHGGSSPWPYNYCPGHEGRMDWDEGPGTTFVTVDKAVEEGEG